MPPTPHNTFNTTGKFLNFLLISFLLISFSFACLTYAQEIKSGGHAFKTGDWLIHYANGPIRRGLAGEIFVAITRYGVHLLWVAYFFQIAFFATVLWVTLRLYFTKPRSFLWITFLLSPAFLLFSIYDTEGGFRKEIIVFTAFSLLSLAHAQKKITPIQLMIVGGLFFLGVFSHEIITFTLPYFLYITLLSYRENTIKKSAAIYFGIFLTITALAGTWFSLNFTGNETTAHMICTALQSYDTDAKICDGAILWLGRDAIFGLNTLLTLLEAYIKVYTPLLLLSFAPIFLTNWINKETIVLTLGTTVLMLPLYFFALDWGRWIHIQVFFTFCLIFSSHAEIKIKSNVLTGTLVLLFISTWSMPHCCTLQIGKGLAAQVHQAIAHR